MILQILIAALIALVVAGGVTRKVDSRRFLSISWLQAGLASGLFWLLFSTGLTIVYWKDYYSYFVPPALVWLRPLAFVFYFLVGVGLRWLALRTSRHSSLVFCLLGGVESIPEHVLGIYRFHILDIPILQGIDPLAIFIFAFFEYVIYWAVVLLLAAWLASLHNNKEVQAG